MTLAAQKNDLRKWLSARRDRVDKTVRARASGQLKMAIKSFLGCSIAGYAPIGSEADPLPALDSAAEHGPTALPVVEKKAHPLVFHHWVQGEPLECGAFGVMVPVAQRVLRPDIVIVPLLGFSDCGARIGYGGGFYDRTIAVLRRQGPVICIGFGFEVQRAEIPTEATDQTLDMIVTERGIILDAAPELRAALIKVQGNS